MARQRFDTAPEFNVDQDSVVIRQAVGSAASILEVLDESATPVFTIHNSGEISMPSVLSVGGVSSSEMSHLSGVSSNIQTQLNTKAPSAAPTFTGSVTLPSTTSIGLVSSTEISYLDGVTSSIQSQIDTKAPSATPTFTGPVTLPATTSIGPVSAVEIGYIDGVTSAIQTQINAKAPLASPTFTGTVTLPSDTSIGNVSSTEIGYVDGVTSSIQTQLNSKAPTANPSFTGNATFDTNTLFVDGTNDVVGVGTTSPSTGQYGDFGMDVYGRIRIRGGKSGSTSGIALGTANPTANYYNTAAFMGMEGSGDNSGVGFWHHSAWRLLVDTAGRMTTPYQPFFYAQHAGGNTTYTGIWNPSTVRINNGSYYNTGNGRFTPGAAGYVLCSFSSLINTPLVNSHFYVYFTVNGAERTVRVHTDYAHQRSYEPITNTAIVYVGASDFVECYVVCQESAAVYGSPWGGGLMYAFLG